MKHVGLLFTFGVLLSSPLRSALGASAFQDFVGRYEVVKVAHQTGADCQGPRANACVKVGDTVVVQSSETEASVRLEPRAGSPVVAAVKMTEYEASGEGRFSYGRFTRSKDGAGWASSSTASRGRKVKLDAVGDQLYYLELIPASHPYDGREYRLILSLSQH